MVEKVVTITANWTWNHECQPRITLFIHRNNCRNEEEGKKYTRTALIQYSVDHWIWSTSLGHIRPHFFKRFFKPNDLSNSPTLRNLKTYPSNNLPFPFICACQCHIKYSLNVPFNNPQRLKNVYFNVDDRCKQSCIDIPNFSSFIHFVKMFQLTLNFSPRTYIYLVIFNIIHPSVDYKTNFYCKFKFIIVCAK